MRMDDVTQYPLVLFALSFVVLWLTAWIGWSLLRKKRPLDEEMRQDFGFILAGMLTLLALLIGFSFSMAAGRYDLRKTYEEAEANAIGTEYVRAHSAACHRCGEHPSAAEKISRTAGFVLPGSR